MAFLVKDPGNNKQLQKTTSQHVREAVTMRQINELEDSIILNYWCR